jgi:transposase
MNRNDLERLSKDDLIEMVLRLQRPEKTSRNSSKPPSTDRKEQRENAKPGGAKPGHQGHWRSLDENPAAFEDHAPTHCPCCGLPFAEDADRVMMGEYDEIELPPMQPFVRRHRRFSVRCAHCGEATAAALPAVAKGTPPEPVEGRAAHPRARGLFEEPATVLLRATAHGDARPVRPFDQRRRADEHVQAHEGRIRGATDPSADDAAAGAFRRLRRDRGAHRGRQRLPVGLLLQAGRRARRRLQPRATQVVRDVLDGHRPDVWTSDRYSAQQSHADRQQTCLAHLARDARFADENSDDDAPFRLRLWFDRAFALARDIETVAVSTVRVKRRALERDINSILNAEAACQLTRELLDKVARARDQLLTFCDFPGEVEATNNVSERGLRPCVIQRKVTNGYRAEWAAHFEAGVRTAIDTARLAGAGPFQTLLKVIHA